MAFGEQTISCVAWFGQGVMVVEAGAQVLLPTMYVGLNNLNGL